MAPVGGVAVRKIPLVPLVSLEIQPAEEDSPATLGYDHPWYLHSHLTWDWLCHSCISSFFLPHGAFPEEGAYAFLEGMHAGSLEALRVTRPEAVGLERTKQLRRINLTTPL